jgi:hypothetical protein
MNPSCEHNLTGQELDSKYKLNKKGHSKWNCEDFAQ